MFRALPLAAAAVWVLIATLSAQGPTVPSARLVPARPLVLPAQVDTNTPMTWDIVAGQWTLLAMASWGGTPVLLSGPSIDDLQSHGPVSVPTAGTWIASMVADHAGAWYAYYHHEEPAETCGRPDRFVPSVASLRSLDRGRTWEYLGVVLGPPPGTIECASTNRYLLGGVGDVGVMLDPDGLDLYLFFSQYSKNAWQQGVGVARMAWADRDSPRGRATVWNDGAWLPVVPEERDDALYSWEYPAGTPLVPVTKPWHDGNPAADAFWGASVHWNEYLEQYVMLLNRARDEQFNNEGIYISFAPTLDDPAQWSPPRKLRDGGGWYPQVVGLEPSTGTDKRAGRRARFFLTGRSDQYIEFEK